MNANRTRGRRLTLEDDAGITAIEYALLGTLVALAIIVGAALLGTQLNSAYENIGSHFGQ
ncbi:MAG: Flp family type IVb pilin [Myxococcales bacterium]|jgi:pilus assembly protein Flp/PilA